MITAIIFIVILSILVLAHEWGHFITARKSGMKVYEFGIGFPPRAFGFYKDPKTGKFVFVGGKGKSKLSETVGGEEKEVTDEFPSTLYSINWLPLGGFVKIKGENGENAQDPDSFGYHPAWKKLVVLVAGVFMNFVLAAVLLGFGFMIGLPADAQMLSDKHAVVVEEPSVIIQQVDPETPAEEAGLQFGDKILQINGTEVVDAAQLVEAVGENGEKTIEIEILRGDESLNLAITPKKLKEDGPAKIGVMLADAGIVRYPWYIAIFKGFSAAWFATINIIIAFYALIKGLILGQGVPFSVAGPVGIAVVVGKSARLGLNYLINVTAMISLSLAVINILPIPALDGGRALFVIIEKITGRPVPLKYEQVAHTIGFLLLMALIIFITVKDVIGLF